MQVNEFREYFRNMNNPWYFAKPDHTRKLLEKIGYIDTKVQLHNARVILTNRETYSRFVKRVILKPFLERLSDDKTSTIKHNACTT
jgi:trans-aconitate 2-methyltransferase